MPIVIAYANFETLDMAIDFYNGKVPDGYVPIFIESQLNELITERNNAEKREYEVLGRANALEAELKATQARLDVSDELLREEFAQKSDAIATLRALEGHVLGRRTCRCGMPWEPDMDQFGCWACGAENPVPNAGCTPDEA